MVLPTELISIVGIAVIGYVGKNVIVSLGGNHLAVAWEMILTMAGAVIGIKFVWDGIKEVAHTVGVMF